MNTVKLKYRRYLWLFGTAHQELCDDNTGRSLCLCPGKSPTDPHVAPIYFTIQKCIHQNNKVCKKMYYICY